MKKTLAIFLCGVCPFVFGQIGIKTDKPHPSSDLELGSTNKALYLNRVSNPENEISSPQNGMILYDITLKCVRAYQGDSWSKCLGVHGGEQGTVVSLECTSASHSGGSLVSGTNYTGSSRTTIVPYTGGNGGSYPAINLNSTGVTGLVAELAAGTLSNGSGNLVFQITGTPSGAGSALFTLSIGGKSCSFTRNVEPSSPTVGTVTSLNCNAKLNPANLFVGQNYFGVLKIPYTGGNGGSYDADTFTVKGLTFTRSAGNFSVGNGEIIYSVSGVPSSAGVVIITSLEVGGQSCTSLNVGVVTGFTLYCGTGSFQPTFNPEILTTGQPYNGTYTVKYFTISGGFYDGTIYPAESFTINGLTFVRNSGAFIGGVATDVVYTVTGTPINSGSMNVIVNLANQSCTFTKTITTGSMISTLECGSAALSNGNFITGSPYSGTLTIPYTGGNGSSYPAESISQNGLTFTRPAGNLLNGNGNIVYNVTGTPSNSNTMIIPISLSGKNCTVSLKPSTAKIAGLLCNSLEGQIRTYVDKGVTYTSANPVTIPDTGGISYFASQNGSYPTVQFTSYPNNDLVLRIPGANSLPTYPSGAFELIITGRIETTSGSNLRRFDINIGGTKCTFAVGVNN